MIKKNTSYKAGSRTDWAKLKKTKDVDLALIGAYWGRGKRSRMLGAFLLGVYNEGQIEPITKIGTGFSEYFMREITERLEMMNEKPSNVKAIKAIKPDVWLSPKEVWEIRFDSITKSPKYTLGFSLRFPRFIRIRNDKRIEDCTSTEQLNHYYK